MIDELMALFDTKAGLSNERISMRLVMPRLAGMAEDRRRPLISWSEHDWRIGKRISGDAPFRYRNALKTVKRWRHQLVSDGAIDLTAETPNRLSGYEQIIEYDRPHAAYEVGDSIAYMRRLKSVSDAGVRRWRTTVEHNRHDLIAMRDVVLATLGLPSEPTPGRSRTPKR